MTNRRRVSDNNNISLFLGDSFSVSQQPPSWDPCSHYSMLNSVLNVKAVVAAFNQEEALVGAFSVITNLRMQLFEALIRMPWLRGLDIVRLTRVFRG